MKVFYAKKGYNIDNLKDADTYVVILTANNWDDCGYKTSFNAFEFISKSSAISFAFSLLLIINCTVESLNS